MPNITLMLKEIKQDNWGECARQGLHRPYKRYVPKNHQIPEGDQLAGKMVVGVLSGGNLDLRDLARLIV